MWVLRTHKVLCGLRNKLQFKVKSMKGLISRLLLSCEQASILVIKKEENKLSQTEKFQLWMHSSICGLCKEFDSQNNFINTNLEFHYNNQEGDLKLSENDKKKMKMAILENQVN